MKRIILLAGVFLFAIQTGYPQQEISELNSEKRVIGSFHAIEASAGVEVFLTKGNKEELAVSVGDLEYLSQVKTRVSSKGVLTISRETDWKFWNTWKNWKVRVYVSYVNLDQLEANSGSSITAKDLQLTTLKAEVNSGGLMKLSGKTDMLEVEANSGGTFRAAELVAAKCMADANSGGSLILNISKELSAEASSGGSIKYSGEGIIRNISTNSGGSVRKQ